MSFFRSIVAKCEVVVVALALASTVTCASPEAASLVPRAYIVEFMDDASADAVRVSASYYLPILSAIGTGTDYSKSSFFTNLSDSQISASPRMTLAHQLFNGASFMLEGRHDNETSVQTIQNMGMVNKIWPVRLYSNPATLLTTLNGISSLQASELRKRASVDTWSTHVMGGVDKLHDEGITGEGTAECDTC